MQAAVSGKASGHLSANASSISEHHDCTSCLEGTIVSKAELNFRAEQSDTGEHYTLQQSQQCQSGNFYLSSNGGASDSQSCPQHTYQVTFTVLDSSGNKVEHAAIQADNAMPAVSLNTDISGRASCYLPNGNYPITVSFPDGTTKYSKIVIQDQPKSIVIRAKNPSYETIAPDEIHTAPKFKSVTFGDGHGGAVSQNGDLYTWGLNRYGSTGIGRISYTVDEIITPVKVLEHVAFADFGGESSAAVTENGDLYTWGWNRFGQLGYETEPVHTNDSYSTRPQKVELPGKVKALSMGSTNCAAILENGDLYTWGSNAQGKLGRGGSYSEYNPLPEKVNLPNKAVNVKMGGYESSAILENGDLTERVKLVENITLSLSDASTEAGSSIQLEAVVFPSDAANPSLKWISENPDIAVVDQNGLVTGITEGKARIVVQSQDGSNIFAGCIVTVTLKPSAETNPDDVQKPSANNPSSGGSYPSGGSSASGSNPSGNTEVKLLYYIVSFNPNGGNRLSRKEMTLLMDERLGILPHVQMKGHLFSGWYTQKTNGRKVDENTAFHASTTLYAQWDTVTKPDKIKNLSLSDQGDGLVTITIASAVDAQGYEIAYSANKKFLKTQTNKKLVSAKSTNGKSVIKLKKGCTYYIRARAFRKDSAGNNIYGAYSDTKKIKPKK